MIGCGVPNRGVRVDCRTRATTIRGRCVDAYDYVDTASRAVDDRSQLHLSRLAFLRDFAERLRRTAR
jgi:hypothetical protein